MFVKNTAAEKTTSVEEIAAREERECTGFLKYLAERIAKANDHEIDEWYVDQENKDEEEQE